MNILAAFFIVFIIFAVLRVPVGFSILAGGIAAYLVGGIPVDGIPSALIAALDSFPLLAIPAFIFAGDLMAQGGISSALVRFIQGIVGRMRGSLGAVAVITSAIFGAISGSAVATVSAIGGILMPEMEKEGYSRKYICALLSSAGILGTLIPPSIPGVQYAIIAGLKTTDVWMCTLVPGLLLTVLFCIANYYSYGRFQPKVASKMIINPDGVEVTRRQELRDATPKAIVALVTPLIIFGGVYGGIFTATEAGAVSVAYSLLAGWVIYPVFFKQKPSIGIWSTAKRSAMSCLTIGILVCTANVVARGISLGGVSQQLIDLLMSISDSKTVFLLSVNLLLIVAGMFLETNAAILLFAPMLIPVAQAYGVDPLHFGAIVLVNLEIGLLTPPFAACLFVGCKMTRTTINEVMKPMVPFYLCCLPVLLLVTYWPDFSMWLPRLLSGVGA